MDIEMMKAENELRRKMQEICERWPQVGRTLILKALRESDEAEPDKKVAEAQSAS